MTFLCYKVAKRFPKVRNFTRIFCYKQLLYKQGSTRQGKKLSNFSTGLKTAKQFEKCVNGALGRSPTNLGKSYYLD